MLWRVYFSAPTAEKIVDTLTRTPWINYLNTLNFHNFARKQIKTNVAQAGLLLALAAEGREGIQAVQIS